MIRGTEITLIIIDEMENEMTDKDKMHRTIDTYLRSNECGAAIRGSIFSGMAISIYKLAISDAKESSSKELEAAKQRIADLENRTNCPCLCSDFCLNESQRRTIESLEKKLAEAQAWRQSLVDMDNRGESDAFIIECLVIDPTQGTEELTKLLAAAEQRGIEKCDVTKILLRVVPDEFGNGFEVYAESADDVVRELSRIGQRLEDYELGILCNQGAIAAARKEEREKVLTELSEQEASVYTVQGINGLGELYTHGACFAPDEDCSLGEFWAGNIAHIPRPLPPTVKEK